MLPDADRRLGHKLAAEWLLEMGGARAGEQILLVAEHYEQAGEPVLAAEQLRRAGQQATRVGAHEEALTTLLRARELDPTDRAVAREIEDVAFVALEFTDGPIAHIHVSRLDPTKIRQLTVVGSVCSLRYKLTDEGPRVWVHERRGSDGSNSRRPARSGCQPWQPSDSTVDALYAQCEESGDVWRLEFDETGQAVRGQ